MTWTRRVFLREAVGGWLTLVLAPASYALLRRWLAHRSGSRLESLGVGLAEEFKTGSSRVVQFGDEKVVVARLADGSFHGVSGVCTHLGCSIRLEQSGGSPEFACNCHDSRFDLDGINLSGPAPSPLKRYKVEIRGKDVWVLKSGNSGGA